MMSARLETQKTIGGWMHAKLIGIFGKTLEIAKLESPQLVKLARIWFFLLAS